MSVCGDTVYVILEGELYKSGDGGQTWKVIGRLPPLDVAPSNMMVFCDEEHGFVGNEASNIYYTSDGGLTWETRLPTSKPFRFVPRLLSACGMVPPWWPRTWRRRMEEEGGGNGEEEEAWVGNGLFF
jgi:hypothetical protein